MRGIWGAHVAWPTKCRCLTGPKAQLATALSDVRPTLRDGSIHSGLMTTDFLLRGVSVRNSRFLQSHVLSHFDARHPLPIVEDVLAALAD